MIYILGTAWLLFQCSMSYVKLKESDDGLNLTISGDGTINSTAIHDLSYEKFVYIDIKDGITGIEIEAFKDCKSLIRVTFPSKLEIIESSVFEGCFNILSIEFPEGLLSLPANLIYYCYQIRNISISSTIESIHPAFMWSCPKMTKFIVSIYNKNFSTVSDGEILTNKNQSIGISCKGSGDLIIPNGIAILGNQFCYHKDVTSLQFAPDSNIKILRAKILHSAGKVKLFEAPSSLERVEDSCFFRSSVSRIFLPQTLSYLSTTAFSGATNLTVVNISDECQAIKKIGNIIYDPKGANIIFIPLSVHNLSISENLTEVNPSLVRSTQSLDGVYVDPGNEKYSTYDDALYNKNKNQFLASPFLKQIVHVHKNCTKLCEQAFMSTQIREVYFEGNIKVISTEAFSLCNELTTLDFPITATTVGSWCFTNDRKWKGAATFGPDFRYPSWSSFYNSGVTSVDFSRSPITSIPFEMFYRCESLKELTLPPNVESIGSRSFMLCRIKRVFIRNKTIDIGSEAFSNCYYLSEIEFAEGSNVSLLGSSSFRQSNISRILIPSSVTKVESKCFQSCSLLANLTFEEESKLESIAADSFDGCNLLTEVRLPSTIQSINPTSFSICRGLMNIIIGDGINTGTVYRSIDGAVYSKDGLTFFICPSGRREFEIQSSVKIIGLKAFMNCKGLTYLTFSQGSQVESLNTSVFEGCSSLSSVVFEDEKLKARGKGSQLKVIGSKVFSGCSSLKEFRFPSMVRHIGSEAFEGCSLLQTALPPNLERIETKGFHGCSSLGRIDLGPKVVYVGSECFFGCDNLSIVTYCGTTPLNLTAFENAYSIKCFVRPSYPTESLGGLRVSRVLDPGCNIPTSVFTGGKIWSVGEIEAVGIMDAILCDFEA